jgi:hypothetical protein
MIRNATSKNPSSLWGANRRLFYHAGDVPEFGIVKNSGRHLGAFTKAARRQPDDPALIGARADANPARLTKPDL